MLYYVSWSVTGATYFRCFDTKEERDALIRLIKGKNIRIDTWENNNEKEKSK